MIYAQIFGFIALIIWLCSVLVNDKEKILKLQIFANLFYAIGYFILTAYTAVCMNLVSLFRSILFHKKEKNKEDITIGYLITFLLVIIVIAIFTYDGLLSLIPIVITCIYTYTLWQKNLTIFRLSFVLCASGWLIYNLNVKAYAALIGNICEITFGIIAIIKHDLYKRIVNKNT